MWKPYIKVIKKKAPQALHILDRFHIVAKMNKAIDEVRATEHKKLQADGYEPVLKHSRWCLLKRKENLTEKQEIKLKDILKYNLKSLIDVGCGTGRKLQYIHKKVSNITIIGIDQKNAVDFCRKNYTFGKWYVDDIEDPSKSLKNINADLVISSDVIEHLLDPNHILKYLKLKVKKNGFIILSTPERNILRVPNCNFSPNKMNTAAASIAPILPKILKIITQINIFVLLLFRYAN